MNSTETKWSDLSTAQKTLWMSIPVLIALAAVSDKTSPEEQALKDQFAQAVVQANCGPTSPGSFARGFSRETGSQKALGILEKAYPEETERLEILKFLADNQVVLHANSAEEDNVYAAFFNNPESGQRTLLVQAGAWDWTDTSEPLRDLIEKMKTDEAFLKTPGTSILFDNKSIGALDWMNLPYIHAPKSMYVAPETANVGNIQGTTGDMAAYLEGTGFALKVSKWWSTPCTGFTKPMNLEAGLN
ncbi:MAG: hypothetical protein KDJ75_07180 [Alphaproteobacteria bacterium]|nr:hypothetical protein [Alphaproteobacteria bacterium]